MWDFLADLDGGFPRIFGVSFSTVGTLLVCYYELAFEGLLENGRREGFFLDCEFHSDTA